MQTSRPEGLQQILWNNGGLAQDTLGWRGVPKSHQAHLLALSSPISLEDPPRPPQPALPNSGVPGEGASETQFLQLQSQDEGGHGACALGPVFLGAGGGPRRHRAGGSSLGGTARAAGGLSAGDGAPERVGGCSHLMLLPWLL